MSGHYRRIETYAGQDVTCTNVAEDKPGSRADRYYSGVGKADGYTQGDAGRGKVTPPSVGHNPGPSMTDERRKQINGN